MRMTNHISLAKYRLTYKESRISLALLLSGPDPDRLKSQVTGKKRLHHHLTDFVAHCHCFVVWKRSLLAIRPSRLHLLLSVIYILLFVISDFLSICWA